MKKKINLSFFSNSRSEFGLINRILNELKKYPQFKYDIYLSGTHFSKKYGNSMKEAEEEKLNYKNIFQYDLKNASEENIIKNLSISAIKHSKIFKNVDYAILFGDRLDLLPVMVNCLIFNKKIIHFGGGEETRGSIDNKIRNIISIVSDFHFVSTNQYMQNLRKINILKNKIFNIGTLSVERKLIKNNNSSYFNHLKKKNLVSLTYHPVNINNSISAINQIRIILKALEFFKEKIFVIISSPGYEKNSDVVIKFLNKSIKGKSNYKFYKSLGIRKYSNLIQNSRFIIGNSSSGVIMAPYFRIPSINIGNRQDGRVLHSSVINCELKKSSIILAIKKILKDKNKIYRYKYLLGDGNAAKKAATILNKILTQ